MNKHNLLIFYLLLVACSTNIEQIKSPNHNKILNLENLTGKYATEEGDLEIELTEGMLLFKLLIVSNQGRTGDMAGELTLKGHQGIYNNEAQNCYLGFNFSTKKIGVIQQGTCEMGLNVTATGTYQSINVANTLSVQGKVGDSFGVLFYSENEAIYRKYCTAGIEENSGNITCRAREKNGEDSVDVVHVFSGSYNGPDGELPTFEIAKRYNIVSTN